MTGRRTAKIPFTDHKTLIRIAAEIRVNLPTIESLKLIESIKPIYVEAIRKKDPFRSEKLSSCKEGTCRDYLCPICFLYFRFASIKKIMDLARDENWLRRKHGVYHITIVSPSWIRKNLDGFNMERIKRTLLQTISRASPDFKLIGNFDFSYEKKKHEKDYWQPHIHAILICDEPDKIETALQNAYPANWYVDKPVLMKRIKSPLGIMRVANYLFRSRYELNRRPRSKKLIYLPEGLLRELIHFLYSAPCRQRFINNGYIIWGDQLP